MRYFLIGLVLSQLIACNNIPVDSEYEKIEGFSIELPVIKDFPHKKILSYGKVQVIDDSLFFYFFDFNNNDLHLINLKSKFHTKQHISILDSNIIDTERLDCKMLKDRRLSFFSYSSQMLVITDFPGEKKLHHIRLKEHLQSNEEILAYYQRTYHVDKSIFYFPKIYNDIVLNSKNSFKEYFSRDCNITVNIENGESQSYVGYPSVMRGGSYYGETDYYSWLENNKYIFSFHVSDSIYEYEKGKLSKTIYAGYPKDKKFKPFDINKITDLRYTKIYNATEPKYLQVVYNRKNKTYYRVFKHRAFLKDGKIPHDNETKWSIISVVDDNGSLHSYQMNEKKYTPYIIHPYKEGVLVSGVLNSIEDGFLNIDYLQFN